LVDAIPRVYDSTRQQRILGEDGTDKTVPLNSNVLVPNEDGTPGGQIVEQNDLSKGVYDVTCNMGATFRNQQEKESERLMQIIAIDPQALDLSRDVFYKNQTGPGMNTLAKRSRKQGIQSGLIGPDEWTEEEQAEQQQLAEQQANQEPQEDPLMVEARGVELSGQADVLNAQTKQSESQFNAQVKSAEVALDQDRVALNREQLQFEVQKFLKGQDDKFNVDAAKIQQGQQKIDLQTQQQQFDIFLKTQAAQQQEINDAINNLKVLREAMGVDAIVGPHNQKAYIDQAKIVDDIQE